MKLPDAPKVLIFDLDGTLVPTMEDYADKAAHLIEQAFGTPFAEARTAYFATSGLPFERQLRLLYPDHETSGVAGAFERWKDGYLREIALPPATATLLSDWRQRGFGVAISSNNLETYVHRLTLDWPVDCALGYRTEDGFGKGEAHFSVLERRYGLPRSAFLFVGDSPNDARIAASAGVPFLALLTPAFRKSDFETAVPGVASISHIDELESRFATRPVRQEEAFHAAPHTGLSHDDSFRSSTTSLCS